MMMLHNNNNRVGLLRSGWRAISSLSGDPILSLVPPGVCQFGSEEFTRVPLSQRWTVSPTSSVLRFALPDEAKPLNLSTCACILAQKEDGVVRPYTPISTNRLIGSFDLLVKHYADHGDMSKYLGTIQEGETTIGFKHIEFNVKIQAPYSHKRIGMIVGGSGITPMIQALHAILGDSNTPVVVDMLYGSRVSNDILGKELLDRWSQQHPDRFRLNHILSQEPDTHPWTGLRGHVDKPLLMQHMPSPQDEDFIIFVCGPPSMYKALCGPREDKDVTGLMGEMGYQSSQVYKF